MKNEYIIRIVKDNDETGFYAKHNVNNFSTEFPDALKTNSIREAKKIAKSLIGYKTVQVYTNYGFDNEKVVAEYNKLDKDTKGWIDIILGKH